MTKFKTAFNLAVLALVAALFGCSGGGELSDDAAAVELIATTTQDLQILDLNPSTAELDPDCAGTIGTINLQVLAKRTEATGVANQVRVFRYRVSYQRTDGGKTVPASFVRSMDTLIDSGGEANVEEFLVIEPDAIVQAPFVALLPQNGGRDPDTGRPIVKMEVIMEFFGETLGGDNVYDATRFPLDFCYGCGCS